MASPLNKDFWLACGHHLLDREEGGGLLVTDDFLKVYLARPELSPPPRAPGVMICAFKILSPGCMLITTLAPSTSCPKTAYCPFNCGMGRLRI